MTVARVRSFITLLSLPLVLPSSDVAEPLALGRSLTDFQLKTNAAQNDLTVELGAFRNSQILLIFNVPPRRSVRSTRVGIRDTCL